MRLGTMNYLRVTVSDWTQSRPFYDAILGFRGFHFLNENEDRACYEADSVPGAPEFVLISKAYPQFRRETFELGVDTVYDDEIAALAADDADLPAGRQADGIGGPDPGFRAVISAAMDSSNAATFCDGCDQLTAGREACAGPTRSGAVVP